MKLARILLAFAGLSIAGAALAAAAAGEQAVRINVDKKGVALHGYDPVTYFDTDKPQPGTEGFSYSYMGATWRFVSTENRKKFAQDHEMYMPQFGGYCAKAVSENKLADVDPLAYKIVNGKLYLNYDAKIQKLWEQDIPGRIARAETNWPGLQAGK
jgi:YHS domain-containing protein